MEVLDEQALMSLSSLALLDLSKNNLRTLSAVALRPLISLQVLRITGTFLDTCKDLGGGKRKAQTERGKMSTSSWDRNLYLGWKDIVRKGELAQS